MGSPQLLVREDVNIVELASVNSVVGVRCLEAALALGDVVLHPETRHSVRVVERAHNVGVVEVVHL